MLEKENLTKNCNPFDVCQKFLNDPSSIYIIGGGWKEKFNLTLKLIFETIKKLENEEKLENFSFKSIEECINFLNSVTVEKERSEDLCNFIRQFIFIVHNLNQNLNKYETITKKIFYLQRYCDNALTFSETVSLLNTVSHRLNRWKDFSPPSFRLSKHYYSLLKEE